MSATQAATALSVPNTPSFDIKRKGKPPLAGMQAAAFLVKIVKSKRRTTDKAMRPVAQNGYVLNGNGGMTGGVLPDFFV